MRRRSTGGWTGSDRVPAPRTTRCTGCSQTVSSHSPSGCFVTDDLRRTRSSRPSSSSSGAATPSRGMVDRSGRGSSGRSGSRVWTSSVVDVAVPRHRPSGFPTTARPTHRGKGWNRWSKGRWAGSPTASGCSWSSGTSSGSRVKRSPRSRDRTAPPSTPPSAAQSVGSGCS